MNENEKKLVLNEAEEIPDVKKIVASILLVQDLRIQKDEFIFYS